MTFDEMRDKINAKGYEPRVPYVRKPKTPPDIALLSADAIFKFAADNKLEGQTIEQVRNALLAKLQNEYTAACAARDSYNADAARCQEEWENDLLDCAVDYGYPKDSPLLPIINSIAWDRGHSYGHSEVLIHFQNMLESFLPVIDNYRLVKK